MPPSTHYSLQDLMRAGRKIAIDKEVVSFDLFDTLLVRRIHDPDLIKLPVARYISQLTFKNGMGWKWRRIQARRDAIEKDFRAETGKQFADHEACYPLFMRSLLKEIFAESYDEALLDKVTEYELAMENSMLVPRQELINWITELVEAGKRVFVISDMYLPAVHLRKLIEYAGFLHLVEEVISSADSFLAKASGCAYPLIAEKFHLKPERWLHVGDNAYSDGLRAEEAGLTALIIDDPGESQRKSIIKRYFNYSDGRPFWRGRVLQQLMAPLEGENSLQPDLYNEGYNFIGPLVGLFVLRIAELCLKNGITKIFFLSREGWTFKRYWDQAMIHLYPHGGLPETEYLYVSRMALAGSACAHQGLTKENAAIAFLPPGNRDFRDVCRIFGMNSELFASSLQEYGIAVDTCLSNVHEGYDPENREKFEAMLEDDHFQVEVKRQTRGSNQAMQLYFEEAGLFDHTKIALVDIGWLGTIQRFLFESIAHRDDCPYCFGYLFGATRGISFPTSEKNRVEGIIYDRDRFDLAASSLYYARDVFEEACRAPHPTLNGYQLTEDGYELVFRQTDDDLGQAEVVQDKYFAPLQQGILDSARRFGAAVSVLGYTFDDCKSWINYLLLTKLAFPRAREVAAIRHQHHLDDFHGKKTPKNEFTKGLEVSLWEQTQFQLRCNPFLRIRHFFRHLRERINE